MRIEPMRMVNPYLPTEIGFRRSFLTVTLGLYALASIVFLAFPEIDIEVSREMRICPGAIAGPWCVEDPTIEFIRDSFIGLTVAIGVAILIGLVRTLRESGKWFGLAQARWWFLLIALGVGPGLVANVVFKDNWGRARPHSVTEFGGTKQFTPPLVVSQQCRRNCSFFSGEVSSAVIPFFTAALLLPQVRIMLLGGGVAIGLAAGLIRISQGGHFLSDVVFACIFMALTASILHIVLVGLWHRRRLDDMLEPYLRPARGALVPHLSMVVGGAAQLSAMVRAVSASHLRRSQEAWARLAWPRISDLISVLNQARP